jgi:hypothetical protein
MPSCATMKLMEWYGLRPSSPYRSDEPAKREASWPGVTFSTPIWFWSLRSVSR